MWFGRLFKCIAVSADTGQKCHRYIAKRHFKMKKSSAKKRVPSSEKALEHFDTYYWPMYKNRWPSIRISLLSTRKTAAVVNSLADADRLSEKLHDLGASNILSKAVLRQRSAQCSVTEHQSSNGKHSVIGGDKFDEKCRSRGSGEEEEYTFASLTHEPSTSETIHKPLKLAFPKHDNLDPDRKDLDRFMPTKTVYSDFESLRLEEAKRNVYTPSNLRVNVTGPKRLIIPENLKVFSFPQGDSSRFPDPSADKQVGFLGFYLLDAASVLPVVALDISPGDHVLDMCAAPGGKTLSILQTGLPDKLQCNDISGSRIARLLDILQYHVPEETRAQVTVTRKHGSMFTVPQFDRVLVDVPCSTDRHSLLEETNNLFSPSRITDRLHLPSIQKELLKAGIQACLPGGSVVYSTCTLAASQNDGVVQHAIEEVWQQTGTQVTVEDLSHMADWFQDTFTFFPECRLGQLVLPSLTANFGPMYFSKLNRIS